MNAAVERADRAALELRFATSPDGRTYIEHQFCRYPFHICRAQYLDPVPAGLATVYLQSSAGGIFAHDRLSCDIHTLPGSRAHVTTQASTIAHRMDVGYATHDVAINAEADSFLEYLPDPVILFPRADLRSSVAVRIHPSATVLITDSFMAHDPAASQESFERYQSEVRVEAPDGAVLCLDRLSVRGDEYDLGRLGVMGEGAVHGTFMALDPRLSTSSMCDLVRDQLPAAPDSYAGASLMPNGCGLWVRMTAADAVSLRSTMLALWSSLRSELLGHDPHARRK